MTKKTDPQNEKTISPDVKLKALALWTMGADHYKKMREFELALSTLLGYGDGDDTYCGCISDEMYDKGSFEKGLRKEGFVVRKS